MNRLFRSALFAALSLGLILAQPMAASAQTVKDRAALVVKLTSIDKLLETVSHTTKAAGFPFAGGAFNAAAGLYLDGVDTERPIGGYLTLTDGVPQFVGFVPVSDLDDVITILEDNGIEIEKDGDDYLLITPFGEEIIIRGKGKWAFISADEDSLSELPADPAKLVSDIDDKYLLGVKAYIQRIPADLRSQAIEWMEEAFDQANNGLPRGAAELQRKMNANSLDQLADIIQEADEIFFGFGTSTKDKNLFFDFSFTGKQGSELAKNLAAGKGAKTEFAGVLKMEDAAATFVAASKVGAADAANAKGTFKILKDEIGNLLGEDGNLSEDDRELIESLVGDFVDAVSATIDSGKVDAGGAVLVGDKGINIVAGAHIVDAKKIEAAVKRLIDKKGDELPPQIDIALDDETHKGVTLHKLSGQIPEDEVHPVLGETTTLVLGVSKSKVFIGFGENPVDKVKSLIDGLAFSEPQPPTQFNIKLSPFLRLAGDVSDNELLLDMADKLEDEGNQMIRITADFIKNGQVSRFEVEDGVLSLIQVGMQGLGGGFGGGF